MCVFVRWADYPRLDTSSYESLILSMHTNIPFQSTLTFDLASQQNCVLPYIPPHPAKQNPNLSHRIMVIVAEQQNGRIDVQLPPFSQRLEQEQEPSHSDRSAWVLDVHGPAERQHRIWERVEMGPYLKMAKRYGFKVLGLGYWKTEWSVATTEIFRRLGK